MPFVRIQGINLVVTSYRMVLISIVKKVINESSLRFMITSIFERYNLSKADDNITFTGKS